MELSLNTKAVSKVSYENKEYILQFFEGVHEEESRTELIEVYRKAKAWDKIQELLTERSHKYAIGDNVMISFNFDNKMEEIVDEYESGDE